jgi:hypothetical protein
MGTEENLLHLCIHLPFFKIGLRELADVSNLCRVAEPEIDWHRFAELVKRWHAEDAAYRVLSLARAVLPFPLPEFLLRQWEARATSLSIDDTRSRIATPGLLLKSRSTHIAKIEKAFAFFRLTGNYREKCGSWLAMWKLTLFPSREELPRLLAKSRVQAARKIWSAMARELGQGPLVLVTLLNVASLGKATARRIVGRNGASLALHPARKLLEILE